MKKCKFCMADLVEDSLICPACGKDNAVAEEASEPVQNDEKTMVFPGQEAEENLTPDTEQSEEGAQSAETEMPSEDMEKTAHSKVTPGKIALAVAAIVVLAAALIALLMMGMKGGETAAPTESQPEVTETMAATVPADGEAGTVTEKGTYSASDDAVLAAADTVVAKMGDKTLTNGLLQVYYWMGYHNFMSTNYSYAQYFGLDLSQPMDVQIMNPALHGGENTMTWQHYFLQLALDSWAQVQSVALEAEAAGLEMAQEDRETLENLETTLEQSVAAYGITVDEYLRRNFGSGADLEDYREYQRIYFTGAPYFVGETEKIKPTEEEMEAYFAAHEDEYVQGGVTKDSKTVNVRHILLTPENPAEDGTYTDEAWKACEEKAQTILDNWLAEDNTEAGFAELANANSTDPGSNTNGGLYEDVYEGQMVATFNDWCFDDARQTGDSGLVKTEYGYHIMYFVSDETDIWKNYVSADIISEKGNALLEAAIAKYPAEIFYDRICLGQLPEA